MAQQPQSEGRPGIGIDAHGGQVIDPTENVKSLSVASDKRQDDLRAAADRLNDLRFEHVKELATLRETHARELAARDEKAVAVANAKVDDIASRLMMLERAGSQQTGKGEGVAASWSVLLGAAVLGGAIIAGFALFHQAPTTPAPPVIVSIPAPAAASTAGPLTTTTTQTPSHP